MFRFIDCVFLCLSSDLQPCQLSSVELQVLTSSCCKLRTVHNIPVTSNKDGRTHTLIFSFLLPQMGCLDWGDIKAIWQPHCELPGCTGGQEMSGRRSAYTRSSRRYTHSHTQLHSHRPTFNKLETVHKVLINTTRHK